MEKNKFTNRSFFKQTCLNWLITGLLFGIVLFVISLFGGDVKTNLGPFAFEGIAGGISSIIVGPIFFLFIGLVVGLCGYFPFTRILKEIGTKISRKL